MRIAEQWMGCSNGWSNRWIRMENIVFSRGNLSKLVANRFAQQEIPAYWTPHCRLHCLFIQKKKWLEISIWNWCVRCQTVIHTKCTLLCENQCRGCEGKTNILISFRLNSSSSIIPIQRAPNNASPTHSHSSWHFLGQPLRFKQQNEILNSSHYYGDRWWQRRV